MKRNILASLAFVFGPLALDAHCQMPCGIYHDEMVYDQIDQYIETMYKGATMLTNSKFTTPHDHNEFIRWVMLKDKASDDLAELITYYFLQQKIEPGQPDTAERLASAHRMLSDLVAIKQNTDRKFVEEFAKEWEKFKLMFHVEGYECKIETLKVQKLQEEQKAQPHDHDHDDHDHDHDHSHDIAPKN